jgi:AraC family transcriptional regulator
MAMCRSRRWQAKAGWSPFHFHRAFRKVVGETPKRYTQRLRLERAAARLASGSDPVLRIAADAGFASHEVFTRAFRRPVRQGAVRIPGACAWRRGA